MQCSTTAADVGGRSRTKGSSYGRARLTEAHTLLRVTIYLGANFLMKLLLGPND